MFLCKIQSLEFGLFKCQHKVTKEIAALKKLRPDVEKMGYETTA
jgi:hypothetical protein